MMKGHQVTGTVEGTGAAINIQLGFKPARVVLKNIDGLADLWWSKTMPDDSGIKTITAGTMSKILSNGITPYDGTIGGDSAGFTIGADTDINVSAETIEWEAFSED